MADRMYMATQSGSCDVDGDTIVFIKGKTMVSEGHPLLAQVPDYFKPAEETVGYESGEMLVHHAAPEDTVRHFDATENAVALAAEHNIDLATVTGSGQNGRITQPDVQHAIDNPPAAGDGTGNGEGSEEA